MISEEEAIAKAAQVAAEQGWSWIAPARATLRRDWLGKGGRWEVFSHTQGLGPKVRVVLDAESGEVIERGYIPR
jgi:hypothetical protein